ncbi:MAG: shikimate kinase [Tannerellaceae bacterium]|jgi:shikimate kinase|nr:shikimate kinase [Tannerellaceae bacterium]
MKRIFLIGYMGVGKTTIGKEVAKQLNLSFIDIDHYIEARYHKSIRMLFEEKGEAKFREIENRVLHEVALFEDVVISTGGGTPCFFDNIEFMNRVGKTIYLMASPAALFTKLEKFIYSRPVLYGLSGEALLNFISDSLNMRQSFYMKAHIVFDVEGMNTKHDVQSLVDMLKLN